MKFKRTTSAVLLAAIICSAAACGDAGKDEKSGETSSKAEVSEPVTTAAGRDSVLDDLPDKNFGGAEFIIMDRTKYIYEFTAEEETGDIMNDAIHERNRTVEERFNIKIGAYTMDCDWGQRHDSVQQCAQSVNTGRRRSIRSRRGLRGGYPRYRIGRDIYELERS